MGFFSNRFAPKQPNPLPMPPLPYVIETAVNSNNHFLENIAITEFKMKYIFYTVIFLLHLSG